MPLRNPKEILNNPVTEQELADWCIADARRFRYCEAAILYAKLGTYKAVAEQLGVRSETAGVRIQNGLHLHSKIKAKIKHDTLVCRLPLPDTLFLLLEKLGVEDVLGLLKLDANRCLEIKQYGPKTVSILNKIQQTITLDIRLQTMMMYESFMYPIEESASVSQTQGFMPKVQGFAPTFTSEQAGSEYWIG